MHKSSLIFYMFLGLTLTPQLSMGSHEKNNNARYVKTLGDFQDHMLAHISNVRALGLRVLSRYSDKFPDVTAENLSRFLFLHDRSKIASLHVLQTKYGYLGQTTILARLYEFYGTSGEVRTHEQQTKLSALVDELNAIDNQVADDFFKSLKLNPKNKTDGAIISQYKTIEKIADLIEREMNPISAEEFGRPMTDSVLFLDEVNARIIAKHLKSAYAEILCIAALKLL